MKWVIYNSTSEFSYFFLLINSMNFPVYELYILKINEMHLEFFLFLEIRLPFFSGDVYFYTVYMQFHVDHLHLKVRINK